jgi:acetylornithine deacetylase/succinyl-diaminopimelate desuccinylase-like protein
VLLGPIGEGSHAEEEWVDLGSLDRLHDIVVCVVRDWCGYLPRIRFPPADPIPA